MGMPMGVPMGAPMPAPSMGAPNMDAHNMGALHMDAPDMGAPSMGQPNMGALHMGATNMGAPNMGVPSMGVPNMGPPNMGVGIGGVMEVPAPEAGGGANADGFQGVCSRYKPCRGCKRYTFDHSPRLTIRTILCACQISPGSATRDRKEAWQGREGGGSRQTEPDCRRRDGPG
jgi:hypothetical protein